MCCLSIYPVSQYLIESFTVRCVFSFLTDISQESWQTITFFVTHNSNPIFNLLKLSGSCSGVVQCMAEKRAVITLQIINVNNTAT